MAYTLADSISYYVALLCLQYRTKTRATQNIAIYVKQALADMLVYQLQDCFDVDTAVGAQLDIIGKYVGVPRTSGEPISKPYFGFTLYAGSSTPNTNGFRLYGSPQINAQGIFLQYDSNALKNTALPDTAYALLIKLKIFLNSNNATLSSIQYYLRTYLQGLVEIVDNKDMTLTYTIQRALPPSITYNVLKPYLPRPMGVGINLIFFDISIHLASGGAAITSISKTVFTSSASATVTTATVQGIATNGSSPFTWTWNLVSGGSGGGSPTPDTRYFSGLLLRDTTQTSTWILTATDSRGLVANTSLFTVTLICSSPP